MNREAEAREVLAATHIDHAGHWASIPEAIRQDDQVYVRDVIAIRAMLAFAARPTDSGVVERGWIPISEAKPRHRYMGAFPAHLQKDVWEIVGPGSVRGGVFHDCVGDWPPVSRVFHLPPMDAALTSLQAGEAALHPLAQMVAIDEELEQQHPGWMTGEAAPVVPDFDQAEEAHRLACVLRIAQAYSDQYGEDMIRAAGMLDRAYVAALNASPSAPVVPLTKAQHVMRPLSYGGTLGEFVDQFVAQAEGKPLELVAHVVWSLCGDVAHKAMDAVPVVDRAAIIEDEAAFLVALADAGIPPDVQELLVRGNPSRGIAPGALKNAIRALISSPSVGGE